MALPGDGALLGCADPAKSTWVQDELVVLMSTTSCVMRAELRALRAPGPHHGYGHPGCRGCCARGVTKWMQGCHSSPIYIFPELSSWCPAGSRQHEPSSITVLVSGEPLSPPRPSGTALRSGRAAVPRAAGEFNAINNALISIESTFQRNKSLLHQKEATNQGVSLRSLTMGTRPRVWGPHTGPGLCPRGCKAHPLQDGTKINYGTK